MMKNLIQLFLENPIWQTIWFLAFLIWIYAFLQSKDKKLYFWVMIAQLLWVIHFFILWLYSWAFVNVVWFLRSFVALKYKSRKFFIYIFIVLYFIIWIFNYSNLIDLLPIIAWILWTIAFL